MSRSIEGFDWDEEDDSVVYERRPSTSTSSSDISSRRRSGSADGDGGDGLIYMRSRRAFEKRPQSPVIVIPAQTEVETDEKSMMSSKSCRGSERIQRTASEAGIDKSEMVEMAEEDTAPLRRYEHKLFSKELSTCRRAYLKLIVRVTILVILLTWATLPIYWGSLSASADGTGKLEAWLINRDRARIGDALQAAVIDAPTQGSGALWWRAIDESHFPDEESVVQAVVEERTWLAVVVNTNATDRLSDARTAGNETYDPSSAITLYYAQARNEVATGTYLLPIATSFLTNFTTSYATSSAQRYLAAIVANNGTVNLTALSGIAQAPQTVAPGVSFKVVNLRPYTTPEAQAPLLVGQIYICIFAFIIVMAHSAARTLIVPYLTLPSYLLLQLLAPLLIYLPLSLSYALINLVFSLPFGAKFSFSGGFMAFWGFVYLSMAALGLALEAMVTVLGPRFVPMFLVLLIIVNVSTAALPPELQPRLYAYGPGFQFWNTQQALRTILFNTYSHLTKNALILFAWVLISCVTTAIFTFGMRKWEVRALHRMSRRKGGWHPECGVSDSSAMKSNGKGEAEAEEYDDRQDFDEKEKSSVGKGKMADQSRSRDGTLGRWQKMMLNISSGSANVDSGPISR